MLFLHSAGVRRHVGFSELCRGLGWFPRPDRFGLRQRKEPANGMEPDQKRQMVLQVAEPWEQQHSGDVEMTPWKYAKPFGLVLVLLVLLIYVSFADFSVL